jgi:hypothetical protein
MRVTAFLIAAASLFVAGSVEPARAAIMLAASWTVTYYLDPSGMQSTTECINFNKTGEVNGVITGNWNSPTFPTWKGQYVQRGQHFAWHGAYTKNGARISTYDAGDFVNADIAAETSIGAFAAGKTGVTTIHTGTATLTQVPSCSGARLHFGLDPMTNE